MIYKVMTLFPEMIRSVMETVKIVRAIKEGALALETYNIRDYADNTRAQVDDYPYGGGAGQVIQAEPVFRAYQAAVRGLSSSENTVSAEGVCDDKIKRRVIYLSPQGKRFDQRMAKEFSRDDELVFLCGHYEGVDERVLEEIVTDYVSAGDYILTGGELPALIIMDAVARLLPGVLGNSDSPEIETFYRDLLEYPQYSRPEIWHDKEVPPVLLTGNHKDIEAWRLERSIERTAAGRKDLLARYTSKNALTERMKKARVQNIPAIEALLSDDSDILFEGDELYLIYDHDARMLYAGCFDKRLGHYDDEERMKICTLIREYNGRAIRCYFLGLQELIYDGKCSEQVMITFTERNPLSSARVKDYGEFGEKLRSAISASLLQGRTYYEFLDSTRLREIEDAVKIGLYTSAVYSADLGNI
ncbi:MAG: tRNA (guanosine(37)-N1)-methyltransferase TrmD [Lachnospiraceae bacterium]|nr:tRNA (guanosine(37)-N1)-methyltransferase TrmD [Lachnospiraceae bacterium]